MRRGDAEEDPTHKQVIPYLVLRDGERWFLMRRTRAGGDARLHDLWSIGVGGHLNPGDGDVEGGLRREWAEELVADFEPEYAPVGLLNDDTTPVGAVHVGFVYVADAGGPPGGHPRDRQARRVVRDDRRGRARSATRWRPGAGSCSTPSTRVTPRCRPRGAILDAGPMPTRIGALQAPARPHPRACWASSSLGLAGIARGATGDVVVLTATGIVDSVLAGYLEEGIAAGGRGGRPGRRRQAQHAGRQPRRHAADHRARCSRRTCR